MVRLARALPAVVAAAAALVAAPAGCGDPADPSPTLPPRDFEPLIADRYFGVNAQGLRPLAEDGELETLDRHLREIAAGGVDFLRTNIDWPRLEPAPPGPAGHVYEFGGLDAWMTAVAEHGLEWRVAVMGVPTPRWAVHPGAAKVCGLRAAPARAADVAALAGALARRYGRGGSFWRLHPELEPRPIVDYEIWNEPNLGTFWCPVPDPERFAVVADAAADAIRGADPRATLTLGGLAAFRQTAVTGPGNATMSSVEFLRRMLAERPALAGKLDAIGVHAYGARPAGVLDGLAYQRRAVDRAGLAGKPLSFNETGWYTSGLGAVPAVDEPTRASYLAAVTDAVVRSNCRIESFAPHTWLTNELQPTNLEDWYGIADPQTGQPYPTGQAYTDRVLFYEGRGESAPEAGRTVEIC